MSIESESSYKKFQKFLEKKGALNKDLSNEEIRSYLDMFNESISFDFDDEQCEKEEESDNLLFKAYEAKNKFEALCLANKSLEINPNNTDATNFVIAYEKEPNIRLQKYKENLEKCKKILDKDNMFTKENIGDFWLIIETRPYMRTKHNCILTLIELEKYKDAANECEEMLKLCKNDNMGIRSILIGIYIFIEEYEKAEKLYKKFNEPQLFILLPSSIMYYKQGEYDKATKVIKKIKKENEYCIDYITGKIKLSDKQIEKIKNENRYALGTIEEVYMAVKNLEYLTSTVPEYIDWCKQF